MTDSPTPWRPARSRIRHANHDAVHNESHHAPQQRPRHPLIPQEEAQLITESADLKDVIAELRSAKLFAYDSEFIGEASYFPRLCLVQVATAERIFLLDPVVGLDLTSFWELVADPSLEKIVHAGQQDVEPVFRLLGNGASPANLFDTQIAAGFASLPYPLALSKLAASMVNAKLSKGFTVTDWERRPLSASQMRYAADDVRYLPAIHAELRDRLSAAGHLEIAYEECKRLCEPSVYRFDAESQTRRIRGSGSLTPRQLTVLRNLIVWRDSAGRSLDVPPRALVKDDVLIAMARKPIKQLDDLGEVRGLPRPVEVEHGHDILEATRQALDLPNDALLKQDHYEETPEERFETESTYARLQARSFARGIDPAVVASRSDVTEWMRSRRTDYPAPDHLASGWRLEMIQSLTEN